jgi:hypothetical protein
MISVHQLLDACQALANYSNCGVVSANPGQISIGGPAPDEMSKADVTTMKRCGFEWAEGYNEWQLEIDK